MTSRYERNLLAHLDKLDSLRAKLEYLNTEYLNAPTRPKEKLILKMIERLKRGY